MSLTATPYKPVRRRLAIAARHYVDPPMTQGKLAAILGCSRALVAFVEQGTRRPSVELAERWAQALGQPPEIVFPDVFPEKRDGAVSAAPIAASSMQTTDAYED